MLCSAPPEEMGSDKMINTAVCSPLEKDKETAESNYPMDQLDSQPGNLVIQTDSQPGVNDASADRPAPSISILGQDPESIDLESHDYYENRELSHLKFNLRVQ